ncbi:hypothetical protein RRG08_029769 [Elysia crispata]|uniref:Uncharacterized protein n=1 Tax=Elysia crispata TaxID=231223 RepID=A0AAE1B5Q6_9GAST|nr:hypothetical protein RRG08_029769 [Elysia crispata]
MYEPCDWVEDDQGNLDQIGFPLATGPKRHGEVCAAEAIPLPTPGSAFKHSAASACDWPGWSQTQKRTIGKGCRLQIDVQNQNGVEENKKRGRGEPE